MHYQKLPYKEGDLLVWEKPRSSDKRQVNLVIEMPADLRASGECKVLCHYGDMMHLSRILSQDLALQYCPNVYELDESSVPDTPVTDSQEVTK